MKQNEIFKMPSGATLHVGRAPFENAGALMRAILKQMSGIKLSVNDLQKDMEELRKDPASIMAFIDKGISLATSDEVRTAAFACAASAQYSPRGNEALIQVNRDLFDDPEFGDQAREDYYTIMYRLAEVNCKPFFVKTFSGLLERRSQSTAVPA